MHLKKREDGSVREYVVTPYQMAAQEGKYYLICNYNKYDDKDVRSSILTAEEINSLKVKTTHTRCQRCENHCGLTINMFNKKSFIS